MNLYNQPYKTNESFLNFGFYSEGPKGRINKVARYKPRNANRITYLNLGFEDWNESKLRVDDKAITNNQDRERILATVAATVVEFTAHVPDSLVYAQGSTHPEPGFTKWE